MSRKRQRARRAARVYRSPMEHDRCGCCNATCERCFPAAARARRVMLETIRDHRATGTAPPSRVDTAVDRAREEQQWRAVWGLP